MVYPFVMVRRSSVNAADPSAMRLRAARARVYRQIDELDAELKSGEIGRAEHEAQVDELRMSAARILRELSVLESDAASKAEIEREIAAARRERSTASRQADAGTAEPEVDR